MTDKTGTPAASEDDAKVARGVVHEWISPQCWGERYSAGRSTTPHLDKCEQFTKAIAAALASARADAMREADRLREALELLQHENATCAASNMVLQDKIRIERERGDKLEAELSQLRKS